MIHADPEKQDNGHSSIHLIHPCNPICAAEPLDDSTRNHLGASCQPAEDAYEQPRRRGGPEERSSSLTGGSLPHRVRFAPPPPHPLNLARARSCTNEPGRAREGFRSETGPRARGGSQAPRRSVQAWQGVGRWGAMHRCSCPREPRRPSGRGRGRQSPGAASLVLLGVSMLTGLLGRLRRSGDTAHDLLDG